jgi:putative membrane protein
MLIDALLAWLHFAAIFALIVPLVAETILLRPDMPAATVRRLANYDRLYLACALAVIATGLLRLFYGAKGASFYLPNPWFHAKMGLFVLIALLSLRPTIAFMKWRRQARMLPGFVPTNTEIKRTRRWVMIQVHLFGFLPLFAALMARGIGL